MGARKWIYIILVSLFMTFIVLFVKDGNNHMDAREQVVVDLVEDNETIENVERIENWGPRGEPTVIIVTTNKSIYTGNFNVESSNDPNIELSEWSVADRNKEKD